MAARKRRTPAQIAATKKLVALNKRRARMKSNPAKRKAPARRKTTARKRVAVSAPSRRTGKRPTKRLTTRRRRNTVKSYYPNPSRRSAKMTIKNVINQQIKPAAIQASGAMVLDIGYGYFGSYIPDMLNTGMTRHATKGVVAIALGMVASNFVKNATVNNMVLGAMTVTMHDAMKEAVATYAPSVPLGYMNTSPVYNSNDLGYFTPKQNDGLGYFTNDSGDGYYQPQSAFDTGNVE